MKRRIAVFASGSGSNAEKIFEYFSGHVDIEVGLLLCNKPGALVLERAEKYGVPSLVFSRDDFYERETVIGVLKEQKIDWVVLAGFLWLIPKNLIEVYANKILNIHPALLPKYGGKGMYGMNVHHAVVEAGEEESGMTIHFVNQKYDEGAIVFQGRCTLSREDTSEEVAVKVLKLEHEHYAKVVEETILNEAN